MKKILFSLIALMMTVSVMAQGQRREFNPVEMAKRQATEIKAACNLSDEQSAAVEKLLVENAKKQQAERDSIRAAGGDMRRSFDMEKMKKRVEEQNAAVKSILTDEQYAAYEKFQAERRQRFGMGGGQRRRQQ